MFKFTINAKTFGDALASLTRVIDNKNALQIMDFAKVVLRENGELSLTAISVENSATMTLTPLSVEGQGETLINAKKLTDLIRKLGDDVTLAIEETSVKIQTKSGKYELPCVNAEEFPKTEELQDVALETELPTDEFVKGLGSTMYATSTDDFRPAMTGVYIDFSVPEHMTLAATDTRKLAQYTYEDSNAPTSSEFKGVIVPVKAANLVRTLFGKEPTIKTRFSTKKVEFSNNSVKLVATLIQGNFPDYKRVIPHESAIHVGIDRVEMLKALNRVSTFADGNGMAALRFGNGYVDIDAKDYNLQQTATERIECESETELTIGFGISGLTEILSNMENDKVDMAMMDASRPAVFTCGGNELVVLMPMNLV